MRSLRHIAVTLLVLSTSYSASGQTMWYVDDDCSAPGSGTEIDPFCAIQEGVDASSNGDTILVAPGTYTGDGNRDISLFGKIITLRSTDGAGFTVLDIEGNLRSIHRGFFLIHGETTETIIEGLTIINGYLIGDTGGKGPGGGGGGGAFYIRDGSPTIRNCVIRDHVSATLSPPFPVDGRGGGIYIDGGSSATIENCIIAGNIAERRGGGIMIIAGEGNSVTIKNCLITGNSTGANFPGGGVNNTGALTIINTGFTANTSGGPGGAIHSCGGQSVLVNCILWDNYAGPLFAGDQIALDSSSTASIYFSDIQGGRDGIEGPGELLWGSGNIDTNPLFFDSEDGDFRFLHGSPCIDAGNNLAVPEGVITDLDGGPRFLDDPNTRDTGNPDPDAPKLPIVDMGPYEFDHLDCNNNDTPDLTDLADGSSADCNANDIPDECEIDCNGNDQPDSCDISAGASGDCNGNEVPDECDIGSGVSQDCNQNAIPDACDLDSGTSQDCGGEGIPDECPENPGPVITAQPVSQQVQPGEPGFFSVGADGVLLEYQWRKDGEDLQDDGRILGSESATLLIFDVVPGDEGSYDCVVTDFFGACALSNPATLTVSAACPADMNDDGVVGPVDLAMLLAAWGPCADPDTCPADLNADATVGPIDLATLLAAWGPCP